MKIKLTLLVIAFAINVFAQKDGYTVRGVVIDAMSGMPIVGAQVSNNNSPLVIDTITNGEGEFVLNHIPSGRCSFLVNMPGYKPTNVMNVMVMGGKETFLTIKLEEKVTSLGTVEVRPTHSKEKPINQLALISARAFSVEETERFAGSLGDPARMVSNFAGVAISNDTRNDIIVRGNSPMGLLWKIEGVDVSNPNHFGAQGSTGGPVSMLNSNLLANSDFFTGAFPAEYGNATSGVFDLNLRSGNKTKYEFTGQVGFNGFEAAVEGPIVVGKNKPRGSFLVDYRYSTLQLVNELGLGSSTGTAIPKYNDLSVIADLPTRQLGRFKVVGIFGKSFISLNRSFDKSEATTHSQVGFATDFGAGLNMGLLTHTLMLSSKTKLKTSLSYQQSQSKTINDTIDYTNKTYFTNYAGNMLEKKALVSFVLNHKLTAQDNLTSGASANRFVTSFNDSAYVKEINKQVTLTNAIDKSSVLYQAFLNWQHKFADNFILSSGLHYQLYALNKESVLEPRAGVKWNLKSNQSLSFGYGLHSQIQPRSVYFYNDYNTATGVYTENNLDLKMTRSQQFVVGYDVRLADDFRIKSELYYQHLFNVPVSPTNPGFSLLNAGSGYYLPQLDSLENSGVGRNYGVELTIEKFLSRGYYALATVSIFDSKYQGYDKEWRNTAFNTNFAVNMLAGYELKIGKSNFLTFDARSVWSGGMRYIPIDLNASILAGEQVFDNSRIYTDKYKDYFRCDVRIGFKQNFEKISQEFGIDFQNVTNRKNLFSEQYNSQLREITTIYQQGFMPMMLYRINF